MIDLAQTLVVFDAGGVLLRICRSWPEACAAAGEPAHPAAMAPEAMARRRALAGAYETGRLTCEEFFGALAASTGGLYTPQQVKRIHRAWIIEEYPGVAALVGDLRARGVQTAVLSNTNHAHWERFPEFPVMRAVEHLRASHLLGVAKPDPNIYARFVQTVLGTATDGSSRPRIVFFDDLPENVAAANAVGWDARLIDHTGDPSGQIRNHLAGVLTG